MKIFHYSRLGHLFDGGKWQGKPLKNLQTWGKEE
jgi:hypothetical protein